MSTFWRSVEIYSRAIIFLSTRSLIMWYLISMCLILRVLNKVLRSINSTRIITINSHCVLCYPIITQKFFHLKTLWTTISNSNIFCFCSRQRDRILLFTYPSNKIGSYIKTPTSDAFSIIGIVDTIWIRKTSKRQIWLFAIEQTILTSSTNMHIMLLLMISLAACIIHRKWLLTVPQWRMKKIATSSKWNWKGSIIKFVNNIKWERKIE